MHHALNTGWWNIYKRKVPHFLIKTAKNDSQVKTKLFPCTSPETGKIEVGLYSELVNDMEFER